MIALSTQIGSNGDLSYSFSCEVDIAPTLCTSFPERGLSSNQRGSDGCWADRLFCPSAASPENENE